MVNHTHLDHEKENLTEVFGLTAEEGHHIKYVIAFESFKGFLMEEELYPDTKHEEVPRTLTTKSGCLERCYNHIRSMAQKEMMLLIFFEQHDHWTKGYSMYTRLLKKIESIKEEFEQGNDQNSNDPEHQMKRLVLGMIEKKIAKETKGVEIIVDCMRKSKYNLDRFIEMYEQRMEDPDIQDYIKKEKEREERDRDDDDDDDRGPFGGLF